MIKEKILRPRRSGAQIERDIFNALKKLIEEDGFEGITLNELREKAQIEANVFYKRFQNLDDLLGQFAQGYDFWLSGIIKKFDADSNDEADYFINIMHNLTNSLYQNKIMQRLLLWELSSDNATTRRISAKRERDLEDLYLLCDAHFKPRGIKNAKAIAAVLIAGIYYLTLHKERSTFCGVDFNTKEGKASLLEALDTVAKLIFNIEIQPNAPANKIAEQKSEIIAMQKVSALTVEMARKMKTKRLGTNKDIAECTGLLEKTVELL